MDIFAIKQQVDLFYKDSNSLTRIWGLVSEFLTEADKNLASYFATNDKSYLVALSKTEEFKELQSNYKNLQEALELIPELKDFLDESFVVVVYVLDKEGEPFENFSYDEFQHLFLQVPAENVLNKLSAEMKAALLLIMGDRKELKEELLTNPDPELFKKQVDLKLKSLKVEVSWDEELEEKLLSNQPLLIAPEEFSPIHYQALVRSFLLYPANIESNLDFFVKHKASSELIKETWMETFEKLTRLNLEDFEVILNKTKSITTVSSDLTDELIISKPENISFLIKKGYLEKPAVLEKTLKIAEKLQSIEIFKENWNRSFFGGFQESFVNNLCLKLNNNLQNGFYQQVWEFLCQSYVINNIPKGNLSFSFHYPKFYEVVASLDNEKLFYTESDLIQFLKDQKMENKQLEFVQDLLKDMKHKMSIILKVLGEDISKGKNRFTEHVFVDQEIVVLSAFKEKLDQALSSVSKILDNTFKKNFSIQELFYTQESKHSLPNLKGFYLGELKVGGLENYQGHGQQLRQILEPLGFVLSVEIRKEIDHFIRLQEDHKVKLLLVESKNFKKVLTRRNPRLYDILNQKKRMNQSVDQAKGEIESGDSDWILEVSSSLYLTRGLSKSAKKVLLQEQGYDLVEGMELDFSGAQSLLHERFQVLLERIKKRIDKKLSLEPELFEDHLHDISNLILMIEEDKEEQISGGKEFSDSLKVMVKNLAKIAALDLKDRYDQTKEIFASLVRILNYKVQKFQEEEAV